MFRSIQIEEVRIRVGFDYATKELASRGESLMGFSIAGPDSHFVWANTRIEGSDVLVWHDNVETPTAIRYGWADHPIFNLFNGEELPAAPFRTDKWPGRD